MSRPRCPRQATGDGGYTLIEVVLTSAILLIVLAILAPLLTGALTNFGRQSDRAGALDQGGLLIQQIEHDVLASSTLNVVGGNDLQLIAVLPNVGTSCVEYKVTTAAAPAPLAMQRRAWTVNSGAVHATWLTLLNTLKLSGQSVGYVIPNPAGATPFSTVGVANGRGVNIDIRLQNGTSSVNELTTTATGRTVAAGLSGTAAWTAECS